MKTAYLLPFLALFLAILCAVLFSGRLNHANSHFSTRFSRGKKLLMARFENIFAPNKKKGTWIIVAFAVLIVFMGGCFGFKLTESTPEERDPASSATESNPVSSKPVISKPIRSVPVSSATSSANSAPESEGKPLYELNSLDLSALDGETICQIFPETGATYLITESGKLFCVGASYSPVATEIELPAKVKFYASNCFVSDTNDLYFWDIGSDPSKAIHIPFGMEIQKFQAAYDKITLLTTSGEVYVVGNNLMMVESLPGDSSIVYNGYAWSEKDMWIPKKIQVPEKIVDISVGSFSRFLLGESGTCYAGFDAHIVSFPGQPLTSNPDLFRITFSKPITKVTATDYGVFLLTADGDVYAGGTNLYSHFGLGHPHSVPATDNFYDLHKYSEKTFQKVLLPEKATDVYADTHWGSSSYFLTESGKLYAAGYHEQNGFLFDLESDFKDVLSEKEVHTPTLVQIPHSIESVIMNDYTYFYQDSNGDVYTVGSNSFGIALTSYYSRNFSSASDPLYVKNMLYVPVKCNLKFSENCFQN